MLMVGKSCTVCLHRFGGFGSYWSLGYGKTQMLGAWPWSDLRHHSRTDAAKQRWSKDQIPLISSEMKKHF